MAEDYGRSKWSKDEKAAQTEALRRIEAAASAGDDTLDLADLGALTALPPEISGLPDLRRLYLGWLSAQGRPAGLPKKSLADITALAGLKKLHFLDLSSTKVSDIAALSGLTSLSALDLSRTGVSETTALSGLPSLSSLDLSHTRVSDIAVLLHIPAFAEERAVSLSIEDTPAADPAHDRRLYMLSRLDNERCAIEVVQYLKGTHPDFRDPPKAAAPAPLAQRLAASSPVGIEAQDGRLEASNPGAPERLAPKELQIRVAALRAHVAQILFLARGKQVPAAVIAHFENYERPLAMDEPTYLLLDGPMAFLRGGVGDSYVIDGLDGGLVAGWRELVEMHDDLRPLLLPPEEDMPALPDLVADATPEAGLELAGQAIEVLGSDAAAESIGKSVVAALEAAKEYFEVAKSDAARRPGLLRRGYRAVGGIVGIIVGGAGLTSSAMTIQLWAASPQGQSIIALLRPIFDAILKMFGG